MPLIDARRSRAHHAYMRVSHRPGIATLLLIASAIACSDGGLGPSTAPVDLSADWRVDSPGAHGINATALDAALAQGTAITGLRSLLVVRHGRLVAERYYGPNHADTTNSIRSITKSVVSLLAGIAMDRDLLTLDTRLDEFLDPVAEGLTAAQRGVTLEHLLTMTGGFDWDESTVSEFNNWALAPDQIQYLLARDIVHPPGTLFTYNSASAHMVSVAIAVRSGVNTEMFARERLFTPLGITTFAWPTDARGISNGGAGLALRPRDLAKIGQLVLQEGKSGDRQLVPESWIRASTSRRVTGIDYGYLWWTGTIQGRSAAIAMGYGGQFIFVVPSLEMVVVTTSTWQGLGQRAGPQTNEISTLVADRVFASVR